MSSRNTCQVLKQLWPRVRGPGGWRKSAWLGQLPKRSLRQTHCTRPCNQHGSVPMLTEAGATTACTRLLGLVTQGKRLPSSAKHPTTLQPWFEKTSLCDGHEYIYIYIYIYILYIGDLRGKPSGKINSPLVCVCVCIFLGYHSRYPAFYFLNWVGRGGGGGGGS